MATLTRAAVAAGLFLALGVGSGGAVASGAEIPAVIGPSGSPTAGVTPAPGSMPHGFVSPWTPASGSSGAQTAAHPPAQTPQTPLPPGLHQTPPGLGNYPYSDADIAFMSGMIPHHAQAVIMAGWCDSHGARKDVAVLCGRIVVGQKDEIKLMQQWLSDRGLPVPDGTSTHHAMKMEGMDMEHDMLMPGMLTDAQMKQLDEARGPAFDRLFLQGMIGHHQGAIDMVDTLFKVYGAAQDEVVFKFANDVQADQSVEIDRMKQMLDEGGNSR